MNRLLLLLIAAACAALFVFFALRPPPLLLPALPRVMLWAWERPERLDFLDPSTTGVAFLAGTYSLTATGARFRPRLQPLSIPANTLTVPVIRIEAAPDAVAALSPGDLHTIATRLAGTAMHFHAPALQIDFDARLSERFFYAQLLRATRAALPPSIGLSITALASWCSSDPWIHALPIDEAVPMLFRMGVESAEGARLLNALASSQEPLCRSSLGVSLDEPRPRLTRARRTYLFSNQLWSAPRLAAVRKEFRP